MGLEQRQLAIGFVPLTDMAPFAVAREKGFFERYGLDVTLNAENSWSQIRDKLALGEIDAAHMLAPMVSASWLEGAFADERFVSALTLNFNGNAITVSNDLFQEMTEADREAMTERPTTARALRKVLSRRLEEGREPLTVGAVFPYSSHNYAMRYWLGAEGLNPDRDVRMIVAPPPLMADHMKSGNVDIFCVGEPWNTVAEYEGVGRTIVRSNEILGDMSEKMLAVRRSWALSNPRTHLALVSSLLEALRWLDARENRNEAAYILSSDEYVGKGVHLLSPALVGRGALPDRRSLVESEDFLTFYRHGANDPRGDDALWFLTQMVRWGQIIAPTDIADVAARAYLPDVYREAAQRLNLGDPTNVDLETKEAARSNGATHQTFIDGRRFNARDPIAYLESFARHNMRIRPHQAG